MSAGLRLSDDLDLDVNDLRPRTEVAVIVFVSFPLGCLEVRCLGQDHHGTVREQEPKPLSQFFLRQPSQRDSIIALK